MYEDLFLGLFTIVRVVIGFVLLLEFIAHYNHCKYDTESVIHLLFYGILLIFICLV